MKTVRELTERVDELKAELAEAKQELNEAIKEESLRIREAQKALFAELNAGREALKSGKRTRKTDDTEATE